MEGKYNKNGNWIKQISEICRRPLGLAKPAAPGFYKKGGLIAASRVNYRKKLNDKRL